MSATIEDEEIVIEHGISGLFDNGQTFLVGVEDDPDGSARVYFDVRAWNRHTHIDDSAAKEAVKRAWANPMGHLTITKPRRDQWCGCTGEEVR